MPRRKEPYYQSPPNARKQLTMECEDFFVLLLLQFGPPKAAPLRYRSRKYNRVTGPQIWSTETGEGKFFAELCAQHGEAKARAGKIFAAYYTWWKANRRRLNRRRKRRELDIHGSEVMSEAMALTQLLGMDKDIEARKKYWEGCSRQQRRAMMQYIGMRVHYREHSVPDFTAPLVRWHQAMAASIMVRDRRHENERNRGA